LAVRVETKDESLEIDEVKSFRAARDDLRGIPCGHDDVVVVKNDECAARRARAGVECSGSVVVGVAFGEQIAAPGARPSGPQSLDVRSGDRGTNVERPELVRLR